MIAAGIDILNPIQWRSPGMERDELKTDFGDQVVFHGGVDNQQTLAFGTVERRARGGASTIWASWVRAAATSSRHATTYRRSARRRISSHCTRRPMRKVGTDKNLYPAPPGQRRLAREPGIVRDRVLPALAAPVLLKVGHFCNE